MQLSDLEQQRKALHNERYRLGAEGHSTIHLDGRLKDLDNRIEAARLHNERKEMKHGLPTDKEVRSKQRAMDSEVLESHSTWRQRTSYTQAQTQVLLERSEAARLTPEMKAEQRAATILDETERKRALETIRGGTQPVEGQRELTPAQIAAKARSDVLAERAELAPTPTRGATIPPDQVHPRKSFAQWTQQYEQQRNVDNSLSYSRDGQERFVDRGVSITIKSNDNRSVKDAVSLAHEKFGNAIVVTTQDKQKREAIFKAMAEQNIKLANKDATMQKRFATISKQVEREKIDAQLARPHRLEESQEQKRSQAMTVR
jgi:hypothetical protein